MDETKNKPEAKAVIAVLSGAIAILTSQGQIVLTPATARLIAQKIPNAAALAEQGTSDGVFVNDRVH